MLLLILFRMGWLLLRVVGFCVSFFFGRDLLFWLSLVREVWEVLVIGVWFVGL